MDKPQSLSVKDYITRKLAPKLMVEERIIDSIITHQFSSAQEALSFHDSVEIGGWGKWMFNRKKAHKMAFNLQELKLSIETLLLDPSISETRRKNAVEKLNSVIGRIDILNQKLNEPITDMGGMEKQSSSPTEA